MKYSVSNDMVLLVARRDADTFVNEIILRLINVSILLLSILRPLWFSKEQNRHRQLAGLGP